MTDKSRLGEAMAFYHAKGFVPSYQQASRFAGKTGHVGTVLDVVDARLATSPHKKLDGYDPSNPTPWDQYYTTMTAEYLGISRGGVKILIVAHGIGPMATLDGVLATYRLEIDDPRHRDGGRIPIEEFHKLENGQYGPVGIVEYEPYARRHKYPFMGLLPSIVARKDPVLLARLGPRALEYIDCHEKHAQRYYEQRRAEDELHVRMDESYARDVRWPYIVEVGADYPYRKLDDGMASAYLLSIGQIVNCRHEKSRIPSWSSDIHCHSWTNGTRLIGVREGGVAGICKGPDARELLLKHWRTLLEPSGLDEAPTDIFVLMQMPDQTWFTQVPKKGACADTYEPEFLVTSVEKAGEPQHFYTSSNYPVPLFRYARHEALAVLPRRANAYELVGEPQMGSTMDSCCVQGYRIEIDHSRRLVRQKVLANDYERMMQFMQAA